MPLGTLNTPVGTITVASDGEAITRIDWVPPVDEDAADLEPDELVTLALRQLRAYFADNLTEFDLPLDLTSLPPSTQAVFSALQRSVPYGETITYGELANLSGTGVPARAIGSIMGANPVAIVIPCHRVLAADGLGGYSGGAPGEGLTAKRWLLEFEGALPPSLF